MTPWDTFIAPAAAPPWSGPTTRHVLSNKPPKRATQQKQKQEPAARRRRRPAAFKPWTLILPHNEGSVLSRGSNAWPLLTPW